MHLIAIGFAQTVVSAVRVDHDDGSQRVRFMNAHGIKQRRVSEGYRGDLDFLNPAERLLIWQVLAEDLLRRRIQHEVLPWSSGFRITLEAQIDTCPS